MYMKFNGDISVCFSYHEKCYISLIKEYRGPFKAIMWRHRWRHRHGKYFIAIIWDDLFISKVKTKLCLSFKIFQNGRQIEIATNFLPEVIPEVEYKLAR